MLAGPERPSDGEPLLGRDVGAAAFGVGVGGAEGAAGAPPEAVHPLLELPTKLDTGLEPGWWFSVYREAREAGGSFRSSHTRKDGSGWEGEDDRDVDGDRSAREAARRARGQVRRYCATHRLNRLGTLTYRGDGCHDQAEFRHDIGRFFVRLRRNLNNKAFPYLWVPEWHPGGHGLHAHFVVGRYVKRSLIVDAWPHGNPHIKLLGDLPVGSGAVAEARLAARYLAKYISKDPAAGSGLHRYEVAQGFQPNPACKVWGRTWTEALDRASEVFGCRPEYVWNSDEVQDWSGPPAAWASWPG